jgi:predicted ATPase
MRVNGQDKECARIVLTGGPGGGKTTAADLFRRELGPQVVVVPEAATLLFTGGFPRETTEEVTRSTQQAIFHVQKNLENIQAAVFQHRVLICDRGTVDGAVYWPGSEEEFFTTVGTSLEAEFSRYDAVIFFETAAAGGIDIEGGNPARIEGLEEALAIDEKLRSLWSRHPKFIFVPHDRSFFKKMTYGLATIESIVRQVLDGHFKNQNETPKK